MLASGSFSAGILYIENVGVEVPGGGVRVGQEVPESLQGDLAQLSVVLASREGAQADILKLKVRILLLLLPLRGLAAQPGVRGQVHLEARRLEAGGEVLHGVDPPVPQQEVQSDPHQAGPQPLAVRDNSDLV